MKRWVDELVRREPTELVGEHDVADLAAPALDERGADLGAAHPGERGDDRAGGELAELRQHELARALDLEPAHERAAEHVSGVPQRDREVDEPVVAARVGLADVALEAGRARRRTDQAELARHVDRDPASVLEPGLDLS